jgi:hypothetical protein
MNIIERIKAKEPYFFGRIRRLAFRVGIAAVAVWTAKSQFNLDIPVWMSQTCSYIIVGASAIYGTAKLTIEKEQRNDPKN